MPFRRTSAPAKAANEGQAEPSKAAQLSKPDGVKSDVTTLALESRALAGGKQALSPSAAAVSVPLGELSDSELMLRVQAGDDAAFDSLIEKFRRPLIAFMYRMVGNSAVAEDLAQDVFLRVYRSRSTYAAEAKFSTWLYRIATNLGLNHLRDTRSERSQVAVSLDEPDEETGKTVDVADRAPSVEQDLMRDERLAAIRRHVQALPERQRAAVIMHKYQEMDYREIARVLKLSESATKSLLFRAYEVLRVKLKDFV